MHLLKLTILSVALGVVTLMRAFAQAPDTASDKARIKAYADMLRKEIRKDAKAIIDQAMSLEPEQKAKFWGVYAGYQKEVKGLWAQRGANMEVR